MSSAVRTERVAGTGDPFAGRHGDRVVVVGGGHNGLVAACYLARAGLAVLVLEGSAHLGGMTASRPLIDAAPQHLVSPCAIDAVYWRASTVSAELGLERHGLELIDHDPAWAWLGDDGESLVLRRDIDRTVAEIARFSRRDAQTYRGFVADALRVLDVQDRYGMVSATRPGLRTVASAGRGLLDRGARRMLSGVLSTSAVELITSTFESEQLRGAMACMASILGSITTDSSGIGTLATAPLHRYGVVRPRGGMQAIPDALLSCLTAAGGAAWTSSPVEEILLTGSAVRGVRLADGTQIDADHVVSAVPPQVTGRLLAGQVTGRLPGGVGALEHAPANASGIGCLTVHVALGEQATLPRHQARRTDGTDLRAPTMFRGTLDKVLAAESQARAGLLPADPPWTATILSARDPSQAPAGQDSVYLYAPTPVHPAGGWPAIRDAAAQAVVAGVASVFGDLGAIELGRYVETPLDLQERLGAPNGCIYHVDQVVTRLGPLRPARGWSGHRTDIDGLVLSGAGTHPGGGVSGIPGQLAARALLRGRRRTNVSQ